MVLQGRAPYGARGLKPVSYTHLFKSWQERKQDVIMHPFLNEKMPIGLIPHVQALLLARHLRGDLDAYPPFLWK